MVPPDLPSKSKVVKIDTDDVKDIDEVASHLMSINDSHSGVAPESLPDGIKVTKLRSRKGLKRI